MSALPPLRYRLASLALAPLLVGHALLKAARSRSPNYVRGRLGYLDAPCAMPPVWLHCASVGEVVTALPLVQALQDRKIGPLVLTTSTPSGYSAAHHRAAPELSIGYLPIDRPTAIRRFLRKLRPRAALILETELWPYLFANLRREGIPIALVNGRLSRRSVAIPSWWEPVARFCLDCVTVVLARSEQDAARFRHLGALPERVHVLGNLKLASPAAEGSAPPVTLGRPFVLAASTHDDEERRIADAWRRAGHPDYLLVIAPRHPERGSAIERTLLRDGYRVARRSRHDPVAADTNVYLADTFNELPQLMAGSELVMMGGSLIPHGGHNVLEAARAERAIIVGPHMENFHDETCALSEVDALRQVNDAATMTSTARQLLDDESTRRAMGGRGRALLDRSGPVAIEYVSSLERHLALSPSPDDALLIRNA